MKRYKIVGLVGEFKGLNIYVDGRSFARRPYAESLRNRLSRGFNSPLGIEEFEELSDREKLEILMDAMKDFQEYGTRHDTNPYGMFKDCGCFDSFDEDNWQGYIKSQDRAVREKAAEILEKVK